jgi:hypothetical protein
MTDGGRSDRAGTDGQGPRRRRSMSALMLAYVVVALLMAKAIVDPYHRSHYTCPNCGTKRQDEHSAACPWKR